MERKWNGNLQLVHSLQVRVELTYFTNNHFAFNKTEGG